MSTIPTVFISLDIFSRDTYVPILTKIPPSSERCINMSTNSKRSESDSPALGIHPTCQNLEAPGLNISALKQNRIRES